MLDFVVPFRPSIPRSFSVLCRSPNQFEFFTFSPLQLPLGADVNPPNMDIILEVTDTFLWDYMYAWALPTPPPSLGLGLGLSNSTTIGNGWEYKPSTAFFSLQPSQAAYQSSLPRDNMYRQGFSLFLIIW